MQGLTKGVLARVQGPFGNLFSERSGAPELWVAGGIGVTPFIALLRSGHLTRPTALLYLFRTPEDAVFLAELKAYAATDSRFRLCAEPAGRGVPDLGPSLARLGELRERECYLCGPPAMIANVSRRLRERGLAPRQIHAENLQVL
jgi:predicted ferric reductase